MFYRAPQQGLRAAGTRRTRTLWEACCCCWQALGCCAVDATTTTIRNSKYDQVLRVVLYCYFVGVNCNDPAPAESRHEKRIGSWSVLVNLESGWPKQGVCVCMQSSHLTITTTRNNRHGFVADPNEQGRGDVIMVCIPTT